MSTYIKGYVMIYLIVILSFLGLSYTISFLEIENARDYHNAIISEIEASDFSNVIINDIQNRDNGFEVNVKNISAYEEKRIYEVKTTYTASIPILGISQRDTITGYAR